MVQWGNGLFWATNRTSVFCGSGALRWQGEPLLCGFGEQRDFMIL